MKKYFLAIALVLVSCLPVAAQECVTPPGSFRVDGNYENLNQFSTHPEAELHYFHCALHNYQLQDALNDCIGVLPPTVPPTTPDGYGCTKIETFNDGDGGMVWKPVAEANKIKKEAPVFLLKKDEANRVSKEAVILSAAGSQVAKAKLRGLTNGNRPTYDVSELAKTLDPHSPLIVRYERDGAIICRSVDKASDRED